MKHALLFSFLLISASLMAQLPAFEWVMQCGNPPNTTDTKTALSVGHNGEFFMAGEFIETAWFGQKSLIAAGGTDVFIVRATSDGSIERAWKAGGSDHDYIQGISIDNDDRVIVAGYYYGTTQLGNQTHTAAGSQDIFLASFTDEGDLLWSFSAGGIMADYISDVAVDEDNNIVIAGHFYGEMVFGDTVIQAGSSSDIYVARFDQNGNMLALITAGGSSSDLSRSVSTDAENRILVSGSFYYDITFGDTTLTTSDPVGVFVARYLPDGLLDMVFQLDGTYLTPDVFIAADSYSNFYLAGNFSETIYFGNKVFEAGPFNQDIFAAKYESNGKLSWARHGFSYSSDQVSGISVDMYDNLHLAGHFLDTIHFNQLALPYTLCCGSREIFMVNYSAAGEVLWGEQVSGARALLHSMDVDDQGEVILSGWFTEDLFFGPLLLSNFTGYRNFLSGLQSELFTRTYPDPATHNDALLYPNPVHDRLSVQIPDTAGADRFKISDHTGRTVLMGKYTHGRPIEVDRLPGGIYFLQVFNGQGQSITSGSFIRTER
jgi:hypothetical protein